MKILKYPLILFFLSCSILLEGQNHSNTLDDVILIPYRVGMKWGYANQEKELLIPAIYAEAELFNEYGLAKVATGGPNKSQMEYGYINKSGEEVIQIGKYSYLGEFKDSLLVFPAVEENSRSSKYGLLDIYGNELIPAKYRQLKVLDNGLIWVNDNYRFGIMDVNENIIVPFEYSAITEFTNGLAIVQKEGKKFGMVNHQGEMVIPAIYDALYEDRFDLLREHIHKIEAQVLQIGLLPAKYGGDTLGKWGVINLKGEEVIPFNFDYMGFFYNGVAVVANKYEGNKMKWGLINLEGELILPIEYNGLGDFRYGISPTWRNGKAGFINRKGEAVSPFKYDWASGFVNGLSIVGVSKEVPNTGRNWGFVDSTGKELVKCQYDKIHDFRDGLACVIKDGKYGFIDTNGKVTIPLEYAAAVGRVIEGYIIASKDGVKFGVLDTANTVVIPFRYNLIVPVPNHRGLFHVMNFNLETRSSIEGYVDIIGNEYFED